VAPLLWVVLWAVGWVTRRSAGAIRHAGRPRHAPRPGPGGS
jgi:hypothetical protein